MFKKWFSKNTDRPALLPKPVVGEIRGFSGVAVLPESAPLLSEPPGLFSMYIDDEAMSLIEAQGHLTRAEVAKLPGHVYRITQRLGLTRPNPMHFILNVGGGRKTTESSMTTPKIMPPIITKTGEQVTNSIHIFRDPFIYDMEKAERDYAAQEEKFDFDARLSRNLAEGFIRYRKMQCATALCHEMVHLFATDEYLVRFTGWELQRLELLTDSINAIVVPTLIQWPHDDAFTTRGFFDGVAYITNHLRKTGGDEGLTMRAVEAFAFDRICQEQAVLLTDAQKKQADIESAQRKQMVRNATDQKAGRNDPCPCGSGKKYKRCCLKT